MRHPFVTLMVATLVLTGVGRAPAHDDRDEGRRARRFHAVLLGANEVPPVSTAGRGLFRATVDEDAGTIDFELSYEGLEGGAAAVAHVHFAPPRVNGGVMFFLCGGPRPPCPPSGTVTGTVTAADVVGPNAQGIAPGQFDEVVRALRAGLGYANVHTPTFPGGEIRGQLGAR
jgi:hypothetical protein